MRYTLLIIICFISLSNVYGQCNACAIHPCNSGELVGVWDWDVVGLSESNRFSGNRIRDMFVNSVYIDDNLPITNDVIAFTLEYKTLNVDGSALVTASGTVLVPVGYPCAASPASNNCNLPWALYYKGTNISGSTPSWAGEIPNGSGGTTMSVSGWDGFNFTFALALAANGYITVVPDYLGFGRNSLSGYHPYLHNDSEAQAGIDLLYAADEFLRRSPSEVLTNPNDGSSGYSICLPSSGQSELFVYGHSQGGQSTMSFLKKSASCASFPFNVKASATVSGAMDAYFNSDGASCDLRPNGFNPPAPCDDLNFNNAVDQYTDGVGYCGLFGSAKNMNNLTNYLWIFLSYSKIYDNYYDADGDTIGDKFYYCPSCPVAPQQATDVLSDATKWWITYRIALKNGQPINYTQPCSTAFPSTSIPSGIKLLDITSPDGNKARIELRCWIDRFNNDSNATINDLLATPCLSTPESNLLFKAEYLNDISSNPSHPFRQGLRDNDVDSLGIAIAPTTHYYCLGDDLSNSHSLNSSINNPQASCMKLEKPGPTEYGHNDCFIPALKEMLDYSHTASPFFKEQSSFFYSSGVHLQPTNLSTQIINNKIHVSWDQIASEVKYELSFKWGADINDLSKNGVVLSLNANTSTNFNCNAGKCTYVHPFSAIHNCYRGQVRVKSNLRCTPYSEFTYLYLPSCDIPTSLNPSSGSVTTGDSITLSWNGNAQYYLIKACVGANCNPLGKGSISFTTANTSETFYNVTPANYRWTVRAICGCDVKFADINDITVTTSAIEKYQNIETLGVKVFPNPANQKLNIELLKVEAELEMHLISMEGKYVLSAKIQERKKELDISEIEKGIYILEIRSSHSTIERIKVSIL